MKRYIPWALALVLSAAVACVAVDVVERIGTLHVLTQGKGTPDNPTRAEQQLAGANVILLMGFAVGLGTGVCACVAAALWWHLLRKWRANRTHRTN